MHTLFIDSLPQSFDSLELRKLFSNHGFIADAYVPQIQRSRVNGRFGFIEVQAWEQGERLIQEIDGKEVESQRIKVQWAKYPKRVSHSMRAGHLGRGGKQLRIGERGSIHKKMPGDGIWRSKQQPTVTKMDGEVVQMEKTAKVIEVEEVKDNLEWLGRSLMCISDTPRDIDSIRSSINNTFQEKIMVRDLGKFKFLLTMESKEIKEKLMIEEGEHLKQWFSSIRDWAEEDVCKTRRLWLEIVGVPIQIWSEQNIRKIAENWGDVVFVEQDTSTLASFSSAKVVIDTLSMSPIEDEAILHVQGKGFRVSVFKARTEYTIIHTGPLEEEVSSSSMNRVDVMESNGKNVDPVDLAKDDLQNEHNLDRMQGVVDDFDAHDGLAQCRSMLSTDLNKEAIGGTPGNQNFSNSNQGAEKTNNYSDNSIYSDSRTKTACFSQNGFSEEMLKLSHHLSHRGTPAVSQQMASKDEEGKLEAGGYQDKQSEKLSPPPGFETQEPEHPLDFESNAANGPGWNKKNVVGGEYVSVEKPPGFDEVGTVKLPKKNLRSQHQSAARRLTRSQSKLGNNSSPDTTESMKKLAEEALRIGEVLGVKVIAKKRNAIKRITDSLKEEKRKRSTLN